MKKREKWKVIIISPLKANYKWIWDLSAFLFPSVRADNQILAPISGVSWKYYKNMFAFFRISWVIKYHRIRNGHGLNPLDENVWPLLSYQETTQLCLRKKPAWQRGKISMEIHVWGSDVIINCPFLSIILFINTT